MTKLGKSYNKVYFGHGELDDWDPNVRSSAFGMSNLEYFPALFAKPDYNLAVCTLWQRSIPCVLEGVTVSPRHVIPGKVEFKRLQAALLSLLSIPLVEKVLREIPVVL